MVEDEEDQNLKNYERNGMACKTGLAYDAGNNSAACVEAKSITFRNKELYDIQIAFICYEFVDI